MPELEGSGNRAAQRNDGHSNKIMYISTIELAFPVQVGQAQIQSIGLTKGNLDNYSFIILGLQ